MRKIPTFEKRQLSYSLEPASFISLYSLFYYLHIVFNLFLHFLKVGKLLLNDLVEVRSFTISTNT
jgi:hypothetical protein